MCEVVTGVNAEKLGAIIRSTSPESTEQIVVLAQDADSFDFYPGIKTPEDYGKYFIQSSGRYEYDDELNEYYDYERFGKDRVAIEHGVFDEAGYIAYNGTLGFDEIMEQDNENMAMEEITRKTQCQRGRRRCGREYVVDRISADQDRCGQRHLPRHRPHSCGIFLCQTWYKLL